MLNTNALILRRSSPRILNPSCRTPEEQRDFATKKTWESRGVREESEHPFKSTTTQARELLAGSGLNLLGSGFGDVGQSACISVVAKVNLRDSPTPPTRAIEDQGPFRGKYTTDACSDSACKASKLR